MRASPDPDLLLLEQLSAPPPIDEARSSLEYWQQRRKSLPLYRRSARREAGEMATRWDARLRAAEDARFESSLLGRLVIALGLSVPWVRRVRFTKRGLILLAWAFVPRNVKLIAGGVVAAWLVLLAGLVAAAVVLLQLA
jgi:hypothetical protein